MSETITESPFDRAVEGPLAERALLPPSAYTKDSYLARERALLFQGSWMFATFLHDLQEAGSVVPVQVNGQPVIVLRDTEGRLRAFHNVCSHRGTQLVCERLTNRRTVACPYHGWIYGLRGELLRSNHFAGVSRRDLPDVPGEELGLKSLAVATWLDFVFVNSDVTADDFTGFIAPITEHWSDYDLSSMVVSTSLRYDFKANWKLIVENFLESYHVPFIHQRLDKYSPFVERYEITLADHVMGIGSGRYQPESHHGEELPTWPVSGTEESIKAEYFSVFPTFLVGVMPDHLFAWSLEPLSAGETIERLYFYFMGDEAAHSPRFDLHREATLANWRQVNDEDWDIVQKMQAGLSSTAFRGALLSRNMERNIGRFQRLVIQHAGLPD